jgi:hypothetical protein
MVSIHGLFQAYFQSLSVTVLNTSQWLSPHQIHKKLFPPGMNKQKIHIEEKFIDRAGYGSTIAPLQVSYLTDILTAVLTCTFNAMCLTVLCN